MAQRGYKFLCFPTIRQQQRLEIEFQQAHNVWNWGLGLRRTAYQKWGISLNYEDLAKTLTNVKKHTMPWLGQATAAVLQQRLRDLDQAFTNFFEGRAKYPRFIKARRRKNAVRYTLDQRQPDKNFIAGERLVVPNLGPLRLRWTRLPTGKPKMVTISRDSAGRYWVSFSVEEKIPALESPVHDAVGVDLGIKATVFDSHGVDIHNPTPLKRSLYRLKILQRRLKHKQKGSKRQAALRQKIARLHQKIAHQRNTFLHQISFDLIRDNQVVCAETLKVKNMLRNRRLARALADVGMGELLRQLKYKAAWYGRHLEQVDQWYPSSKTCSACGHKLDELSLSVREWTCPSCNTHHHRDHNAAINIREQGLAQLSGQPRTFPLKGTAELSPAAKDVEPGTHRSCTPDGVQRSAGDEASIHLACA